MENIVVALIVFICLAWVVFRIVRFIKRPESPCSGCRAACAQKSDSACDAEEAHSCKFASDREEE